jgi:NAD(P)-dependent dehydrogenase (short-subunit alcohol dehydrogenase family)
MTIFNILAPSYATFYRHPRFASADDIVPDLTGKVAIVTGATAGLGLETALQLAKKRAKVYITGRSQIKCQAVVEMIRAVTGAGEEQVEFLQFDLADIKNTKSAAEKFLETSQPLHILVNNAGLLKPEFELTPRDKLESHVASSCAPGSFPRLFYTNTIVQSKSVTLSLPLLCYPPSDEQVRVHGS